MLFEDARMRAREYIWNFDELKNEMAVASVSGSTEGAETLDGLVYSGGTAHGVDRTRMDGIWVDAPLKASLQTKVKSGVNGIQEIIRIAGD